MVSNPLKRTPIESKVHVVVWEPLGKKLRLDEKKADKVVSRSYLRFLHEKIVNGLDLKYRWMGESYTLDTGKVRKFDRDRLPILDFVKGHSIPIILGADDSNIPEKDDSPLFDSLFNQGILRAILASATRVMANTSPWFIFGAGIGAGVIVTLVSIHFGLFGLSSSGQTVATP